MGLPEGVIYLIGGKQTARGSVGVFSQGGVPGFIVIRETLRKIKFWADEGAPRVGMPCAAIGTSVHL